MHLPVSRPCKRVAREQNEWVTVRTAVLFAAGSLEAPARAQNVARGDQQVRMILPARTVGSKKGPCSSLKMGAIQFPNSVPEMIRTNASAG